VPSQQLPVTTIQTPDQRVRVFVSSTMQELAAERAAVRAAISGLHLTPILFELGARPHPPKALYLAYLRQSHVFLGIYGDQYGWIAPGERISGLEDEYLAAADKPKLIYVKTPARDRDPRLTAMIERIASDGLSYRRFDSAEELADLVVEDLAVLLSERFGPPEGAPPPPTPMPGRWQLPTLPSRLVGRAAELAELRRLLTAGDSRLVTLVGPGGIGKTRLALATADSVRTAFPDGVAAVMLAAVRTPEDVPAGVASALGLPETFGRAPADAVGDFLRPRRVLLVLDNFEQVVGASPLVGRWLAEAGRLRVLATSREVLNLTGEHVFPVPPLRVGDSGDAEDLARSDAVELFVDRARAVRPDLVVDPDLLRTIGEICRRLDGLPLAIELAAARVRMLDPDAILRRLDRRLELLTGGPRDVAARQQALSATIQWSYDLLGERDRVLFARLGAFAGGFFLDAAEAVCLDDAVVVDVLDGLGSLVDKSLIRTDGTVDGVPRFTMLETIREFAGDRLTESGESDRVLRFHAEYFERLAHASLAGFSHGAEVHTVYRFAAEAENLRAALRWFLEGDEPDRAAAMAEGLWPLWWGLSRFEEGIGWMESALARPSLSVAGQALAHFVCGILAFGQGNYARAAVELRTARDLHDQLGDPVRAARDVVLLGVMTALRDPDAGERLARSAVAVLRERGLEWEHAFALFGLGRILVVEGRYAEAVPVLEAGVRLNPSPDPHLLLSYGVVNLGWARLGLGDFDGAGDAFRRAYREAGTGDRQITARALDALAAVAAQDGRERHGALLFGAAEAIRRSIGVGVWVTDAAAHEGTGKALRAALGEDAYRVAVAEGIALSADEVTALALGAHGADRPSEGTG
jgi:predicted ATPase